MKNLKETIGIMVGLIFGYYGWVFIMQGKEWWLITTMFVFMFIIYGLTINTKEE